MITGRKVSKKSALPTSFDLATIFKGILFQYSSVFYILFVKY